MISSQYWDPKLESMFDALPKRPKIVMIESMIRHHHIDDSTLDYVDWLIYKPFTQQFVFEMLSALYSDAVHYAPEVEEGIPKPAPEKKERNVSEDEPAPAPEAPRADGVTKVSPRVEAFLNGGNVDTHPGGNSAGRCICCKYSHQFFVAADGLQVAGNDYGGFVEQLKEVIWKYVKADKVVANLIRKGELEETAEYCAKMKVRLADLGIYKLACLCDLLEESCLAKRTKDIEQLEKAFTYVLSQTIGSLDQFIEQAKYKIRS
jgi:hypothetical protein